MDIHHPRLFYYAAAAVLVGVAFSLLVYFLTRKPPAVPAGDVATPCPAFSCDRVDIQNTMRQAFDRVYSKTPDFMPDGGGRAYTMRALHRAIPSPSNPGTVCVLDFDYDPPHRDALSRPGYTRQEFALERHGPEAACGYMVTSMKYADRPNTTPVAASPLLS